MGHPGMWRDAVKAKLLEERERRVQEAENGADIDVDVEIVSVSRLLQLLYGEQSNSESRRRWGIESHDHSSDDPASLRSFKRPRTDSGSREGRTVASAFTSQRVWITGFLRYEPPQRTSRRAPRLCLCDTTNRIPVRLIEPRLELLEGLVLIKNWTVVTLGPSDVLSPHGSLEVHGEPVLLHSPGASQISMEEATRILRLRYPTAESPMYVGPSPWQLATQDEVSQEDGTKQKKRKFHVVFGRVTSVSPVALQDDVADSHYFVEVENWEDRGRVKSVVNVLLAGSTALRWHPFLGPGVLVMVTNLKKVYYTECDMFLLQAMLTENSTTAIPDTNSSLFVWRLDPTTHQPIPLAGQSSVKTRTTIKQSEKQTVDLEGVVVSIMWEDCLVLEGDPSTIVALFHYPWSELKTHVRVGSRVRIYQAHVISRQTPGQQRFLLGLCPRSHLSIVRHAPADSELHPAQHFADNRRRLHKNWSCFGDFSKQPLAISIWWLNLLEVLVKKFRFSRDADENSSEAADLSFTCLRRREATVHFGRELFSATVIQSRSMATLARRFLNSHDEDPQDCLSVKTLEDTSYIQMGLVTLKELRSHIESIVADRAEQAAAHGERLSWPLRIGPDKFSTIVAVGTLRGSADANDLELVDCSGRIPVVLERSNGFSGLKTERGCCVYALKKFSAIVEFSNNVAVCGSTRSPHVISLAVSVEHLQRVPLCSSSHANYEEAALKTIRSNVYVFVTDIGPWKRRRRTVGSLTDFRHVRGIGFRQISSTNSSPDWSSAHCVDVLVSTTSECWFLERYAWYSFLDVTVHQSTPGTTMESQLAQWLSLLITRGSTHANNNDKTGASFEEQAEAQWAKSAETPHPIQTATYLVDRESVTMPVGFSQNSPATMGRFVQVSHVLQVRPSILRCLEALSDRARRMSRIYFVRELFKQERQPEGAQSSAKSSIETDPHTARLINLVGIVTERNLYHRVSRASASQGEVPEAIVSAAAKSTRMCRFKLRDPKTLEAVAITADEDAFGTLSALQPGSLVEFSKLQCFLARNTFKPFITWTHCTIVRRVLDDSDAHLTDAQIFSSMPTTHLYALYGSQHIDRTIKRFVVRLAHVSYVVLKRRCSQCKQPLSLLKRQRMWVHAADQEEESSIHKTPHKCTWKQLAQDSPVFSQQTTLSCSMRCIVDDGSAQSELFVENDVVWELLRCSHGQRRRFEELLQRQTSELSYFATRSAADSLFTSPLAQENAYYQNEWRAFVQDTVSSLSSIIIFAQRFYKNQSTKESPQTTVLSFGKDIQVITPSAPLAQLEAIRVDPLTARHELRRRFAARSSGGVLAAKDP